MNSILNNNLELFSKRFPQLADSLKTKTSSELFIEEAKNGELTARDGKVMLHSKYNPSREAESLISSFDSGKFDTAVFTGFGLGYGPVGFAKKFPHCTMVLFEPDEKRFFTGLSAVDWSPVFNMENIILVIGTEDKSSLEILKALNSTKTFVFNNKAHSGHNQKYFALVEETLKAGKQKEEINTNTLEKFAHLWLNNSIRNLEYIQKLQGVNKFQNLGKDIPFLIAAAGPSLESILPHLKEIQKKAITVCVDTALHAFLRAGVEPDFIILSDPQYYCALHLEFLKSPSSILVTEVAAYPTVFRFECREIVLFSSNFSVGRYFEDKIDSKGKLATGGSVTTTAWDFARMCGASEIFIAGMDLGFPGKQTHIRGSQFEQKVHIISSRTDTCELENVRSLFSAYPCIKKDYNGNDIISDKRMTIFAWWFENNCQKAQEEGCSTFSLTSESLAIPGISKFSLPNFLKKPDLTEAKTDFFKNAGTKNSAISTDLKKIKINFALELDELQQTASRACILCSRGLKNTMERSLVAAKLNELDKKILSSSTKGAASLIFPTQRQLEKMSEKIPSSTEKEKEDYSLNYSMLVYSQIKKSAEEILKIL